MSSETWISADRNRKKSTLKSAHMKLIYTSMCVFFYITLRQIKAIRKMLHNTCGSCISWVSDGSETIAHTARAHRRGLGPPFTELEHTSQRDYTVQGNLSSCAVDWDWIRLTASTFAPPLMYWWCYLFSKLHRFSMPSSEPLHTIIFFVLFSSSEVKTVRVKGEKK